MDYNDNESEGQNIHLAGEESSKSSSVLQPFSLPKFDFDDSHLRFDSLVENEVFLGIPSQEDNHWIEEYSQGSSGIVFSSSAAESCALPRHINVWSEATSTESVELLLKAVGQDEMASGENMIEKSYQDDQLGCSTVQINNLTIKGSTKEVDNGHDDIQVDFPGSNPNVGVKDDNTGCTSLTPETSFSSHEMLVDGKDSDSTVIGGKLNAEIKESSINQVEIGDLTNGSLCNQVEENVHASVSDFQTIESSTWKVSASGGDSVHQNDLGNTSLADSNDVAVHIPVEVKRQKEGSKINDENISRITVEADNTDSHCCLEVPSHMESSKEEHATKTPLTNSESAGGNDCGTAVCSSETEKQLPEGFNLMDNKSSISYERESIVDTNDDTPICTNTKPKTVDVTLSSGQHSHKSTCPGNNNSFDDPPATFTSFVSHDLCKNPPIYGKTKEEDTSVKSTDSTVAGESSEKDFMDCEIRDYDHRTHAQNENVEVGLHGPHPLPAANMGTCREDYHFIEEDVHGREKGDPSCEKEGRNLSLDEDEIYDCQEKEPGPNISNITEQNVETAAGCQPNDLSVLNTEDHNTKLISPSLEDDESLHSSEFPRDKPSFSAGCNDQSKKTELEASKEPKDLEESLGPNELARAIVTEGIMPLGSAEPGELERNKHSGSLGETSPVDLLDESSKELSKKLEHSGGAQDAADVLSTDKLIKEKQENSRTISATIPVTSCADTTSQLSAPEASSSRPSESAMNVDVSPEKNIDKKVTEVLTTSATVTASCQAEESFTFDVRPLGGQLTGDTIKDSFSLNSEGIISTSGNAQRDPIKIKEVSLGESPVPGGSLASEGLSERKARRGNSRSGKGSTKRGKQVKEVAPTMQNDRAEKSAITLSPLGAGQLMTFDNAVKQRGVPVIPTSNLPDLSSSSQSKTFFQQPFTDVQQVQLRAQIFVYGSLIQGAAPDEACMVSAFDGVRHIWEPAWRACVEKSRGQKSQGNNSETPVQFRSGIKDPEQTTSCQGFPQTEILTSETVKSSNKTIPSVVNPAFPLSSPLWSIATPSNEALPSNTKARGALFDHQAVSPLHPFQSPSIRNFTAHTTWPSQAPFPVPWLASSQSSPFGISTNYSAFPTTEPVKLTPVKDSSLVITSGTKLLQTTPAMHNSDTPMFTGAPSLDSKEVKSSSGQTSVDTKTRRRKKSSNKDSVQQGSVAASPGASAYSPVVANYMLNKSPVAENVNQFSLITMSNVNSPSAPVLNSHYSTSVAVAAPSTFMPRSTTHQLFSGGLPSVSQDLLQSVEQTKDKAALNANEYGKVEEAKLQAQEAAANAVEAVNHCESVWNQLKHQNNSGLTLDSESKLACSAAAVAAAACVAKAAAATANIALSAAVQARLMAEEAVTKSSIVNTVVQETNVASTVYGTPSLEISAAREAARRRVEAASAATRHAENLLAIVKAAELAAEAVSHTGKIVAMGDPFSMRELVEAGPNHYWKVLKAGDESISKVDVNKSNTVGLGRDGPSLEVPEKDKVSESSNIASLIPELNLASGSNSDVPYTRQSVTSLKEGSMVEVFKDRGDQKEGWFSASVVSLKDREAFVYYTELRSDEGSDQLKEWVSLESKDGEAPRVRIPHHMTSVQFEGTRKRRRAAVMDYSWSVGDKVDAWVHDCWREGTVAAKNVKDTNSFSVHFPAQGETLMVKSWHLRPTLVWTSEQWIEWCRPRKEGFSLGDTPVEKRPKLGSVDAKGKASMAKSINFVETGKSEEAPLPLSASDKVFNIGSMRNESKQPSMVRAGKSVPDKGGSRVVIGVPKPGKKRKFMEVSKHYISEKSAKVNVPNDSTKLAKFLAPHGSRSQELKNISRVDKDKQVAGSKAKIPKLGKLPSIPGRTVVRKDDSSTSLANEHDAVSDNIVMVSISNDEYESGEQNLAEIGSSNAEESSGAAMVFSSQALPKQTSKKALIKGGKSKRLNQGKLLPPTARAAKNNANEKSTSQVAEPRRSNRRIQPTSRLLEGLQSSLTISKTPSSSHDKSHRSQNKGTTRGIK